MNTRSLGATGLSVSRLGLGLAALGRPGYINIGHAADIGSDRAVATMKAQAYAVLDAAWTAGIRYFDAARSYGRAETFLASWLSSRQIRPGEVTIGSKWGYTYTADWNVTAEKHEVKDHSLNTLRPQVRESRDLLGPYLNLYQIHSATLESGVLDNRDVLNELAALHGSGLKVGLSLSGTNQSEVLRRASLSPSTASGCLIACRRRGICWNHRPAPRSRMPMTPGSASSSRRRWRMAASPSATASRRSCGNANCWRGKHIA